MPAPAAATLAPRPAAAQPSSGRTAQDIRRAYALPNVPDKGTWYRVRLGPYTKIDEINKMRSTMATNGLDVSLVKVKDAASAKAN